MKSVYDQKLYYEEEESEDSNKKEKKQKKDKKKQKKHKKPESSDEGSGEDQKSKEQGKKDKVVEEHKTKPKPQPDLIDMLDFDPPTKENPVAPLDSSWSEFHLPTPSEEKLPPPVHSHPETLKKEPPRTVVNSNPFDNIVPSKPVVTSPYQNFLPFGNYLPSGSVWCY